MNWKWELYIYWGDLGQKGHHPSFPFPSVYVSPLSAVFSVFIWGGSALSGMSLSFCLFTLFMFFTDFFMIFFLCSCLCFCFYSLYLLTVRMQHPHAPPKNGPIFWPSRPDPFLVPKFMPSPVPCLPRWPLRSASLIWHRCRAQAPTSALA